MIRIQIPNLGTNTFRRFFSLAGWTFLSFALEKGAMIIIVFLLARILGAQDYGRLTLAQGLVNSLQIFVVLGAGSVLARYIPKMREESLQRAVEIINLCAMVVLGTILVFMVVALSGARPLVSDALAVPATSAIPDWIVAWVVLTAINSLLLTIMLSLEKGRILGLISLLGAGMSIALVPLAAARADVEGAIGALVIIEIAKAVTLTWLYARFLRAAGVPLFIPIWRSDLPILVSFGLPVFLTSALWAPTIWFAQFIVKTHAPNGLAAVGVFGLTNNILGTVVLMSGLTNRAAMPILSSLQAKGSFAELRRASWMMAMAQVGAAVAIGAPLALAAPFIMTRAGPEFAAHWPVMVIMIGTGIIIAGQTALGNYLLVMDRAYLLMFTMMVWSVVLLGGTILYASYGALTLATSLLTASIIRTALIAVASYNTRRI